MFREARTWMAVLAFLCLLLLGQCRQTPYLDVKVIDVDGDEYILHNIKTYGSVSEEWFKGPQCSLNELFYSVKKGDRKIHKKVPFSDIKEIYFQHNDSEQVIHMQLIKRNGDIIDVDYLSHQVTEKTGDGKIKQYQTTENEITPGLLGDRTVEGKQLRWQGFVGKEKLGKERRGYFVIHSSLVKKIIFRY